MKVLAQENCDIFSAVATVRAARAEAAREHFRLVVLPKLKAAPRKKPRRQEYTYDLAGVVDTYDVFATS